MTLDVTQATFAYGEASVLEDVSIQVADGNLLGLLGPNGSGKTTLLQAIDGLLDLDEGRVSLEGKNVTTLSREEIARRVGYLPQVEGATPAATVFDTVLLGRTPHFGWRPGEDDRQAVEQVLERLGIEELAMREVPTLSGGQRRTVLLARALVGASDALLLDEPTSGLDLKHQHEVMRQVRNAVHQSGLSGIVAIHDLELATRFCDEYALLYDGEVYEAGGEEVLTAANVERVYDVPVEVFSRNGQTHVVPRERSPEPGSHPTERPAVAGDGGESGHPGEAAGVKASDDSAQATEEERDSGAVS